MVKKLTYLEINPATEPQACVIWLHGLGASAEDFLPLVPQLHLPDSLSLRFVFPQAPLQPVTLNGGYSMPAWYDILGLAFNSTQDELGIRQMQTQLDVLVNREIDNGIASNKIVLAGFSQGGALALHSALRFSQRLAGVMALSSYLPLADFVVAEQGAVNKELSIFLAHGINDTVLPLAASQMGHTFLTELGYSVVFKTYPMAHEVCAAEIVDISKWLQHVLL